VLLPGHAEDTSGSAPAAVEGGAAH
jgi:hypothetical protein